MNQLRQHHTQLIKEQAKLLGFDFCGVSKATFLEEEAPRLEKWLNNNYHGAMTYMENHFDKRLDPRLLVDDAKSVVSLLYNYYQRKNFPKKRRTIKSPSMPTEWTIIL
jgi:epoxyqueuosine reductase